MPELPEVETVARTLLPHVAGCVFEHATLFKESTLHPLSLPLESLSGMRIDTVWRRGKLLLFNLSPAQCRAGTPLPEHLPEHLVVHLRMTGRIFTSDANQELGKHTRCVFGLKEPDGRQFRLFFDDTRTFGKILAANAQILQQWPFWRELGPEPLELPPNGLEGLLKGKRAVKAALLDQKVIAGIGNIYADEALFQAGIRPGRESGSLDKKECASLLAALKDILLRSIDQCGSSIRDYRDANGNVGAFQNTFFVYGRGGEKCRKCGDPLQKCRIGGRATVFCGNCQK